VEGASGEVSSLGTLEDMLKKAPDRGISFRRGLFTTEGKLESGRGPYTGDFERRMKVSKNGAVLCEGLREGDLEGGLLY
jgi:hypothetical protein